MQTFLRRSRVTWGELAKRVVPTSLPIERVCLTKRLLDQDIQLRAPRVDKTVPLGERKAEVPRLRAEWSTETALVVGWHPLSMRRCRVRGSGLVAVVGFLVVAIGTAGCGCTYQTSSTQPSTLRAERR